MEASFEWDSAKDAANQRKHGVSFQDAQQAFLDPDRVIARDMNHSQAEQRFLLREDSVWDFNCEIYISSRSDPYHWRRILARRKENL
jgi:uncharacterized DUF497 family protein